jgi:hypothetical protein
MTKFKVLGALCLAAALTAASPVLARGFHAGAGMHSSGAHFAGGDGGWRGGGFRRGGFGPGIAAGVIAGSVSFAMQQSENLFARGRSQPDSKAKTRPPEATWAFESIERRFDQYSQTLTVRRR